VNDSQSNVFVGEDRFAVAQITLYIFAVFQIVTALMFATGGTPIPFATQATPMQRLSGTVNAIALVLAFAVVYFLLARCLSRCTKLVWRIAFGTFLANLALAIFTMIVQPAPAQVVTGSLALAGAVSVWRGRNAVSQ
jgi:hypothetical protein